VRKDINYRYTRENDNPNMKRNHFQIASTKNKSPIQAINLILFFNQLDEKTDHGHRYGKKDLLLLLELQLEIEQIDPAHLNHIADSRLKYFNKILKEQLSELEQETDQIENMFKLDCNLPFFATLSPKQLMSRLAQDIQELQRDIVAIQNELKTFQNPTSLKSWLKSYKIPKIPNHDDFDDLFHAYPVVEQLSNQD
jgi:hypothetical protein